MLRLLSIRGRLQFLSLLLIASLIGTNLLLIEQTRRQGRLIVQQATDFDLIVQADAAVHSFGNLKYWLTDLAVSQLILSEKKAETAREKLDVQLAALAERMPDALAGVSDQVEQLAQDAHAASTAYDNGNRLVGNAMMARGRAHILAVDSRLQALVAQVRDAARMAAQAGVEQTSEGIRISLVLVCIVTLAAVFLTIMLVRSVVRPLRELGGVINAMTGGKMDVEIPSAGRDEISGMARVLTLFRDSVVRREKAERAEARLMEVIENLSEGFVLFDEDDRVLVSNRSYRKLLHRHKADHQSEELIQAGATFESIIRSNAQSGIIREAKGRVEDWVAERMALHRSPEGPITQQRNDGSWIQINEHKTADGGRVALYTDITALKRREIELHHQGLILQQLYDAVVVVGLDDKITEWNTAAERIFGYSRAEMLGKTTKRLYVDDAEAEHYWAEMAQAMARDGSWVGECFNRRKDGSLVRLEAVVFRLYDENDEIVSTIGVSRDITERKQVEEELRESRQTLQAIIDALPATVSVKDRDGRFTLVNPAQAAFYGLTTDQMVGKAHREIGGATYDLTTQAREAEVLANGRAIAPFEETAIDVKGRASTWSTTKIPLLDQSQKAVAVLTMSHDITEQKRVEIDLRRAKDQAESATVAKSQFLANMSHELRTPLNAIIGFSRLVKRQGQAVLPQRQLDNLGKILISADHLLSLINAVLDLSKIEAGQMEVYREPVALNPLIEDCLRTVEPMVGGKPLTLGLEVPDDLPAFTTDPEKVKQIMINLLSNAVKFTEKGTVQVRAWTHDQGLSIAVADSGIGVPEAEQESIFEEFHQADSGPTRRHGGTGLGLSISRRLARLIGGEITLESEEGKGAVFTLSLARGDRSGT
ncbi:MAG: PAS domain S-box protein [Pseudomonadota bacterium]